MQALGNCGREKLSFNRKKTSGRTRLRDRKEKRGEGGRTKETQEQEFKMNYQSLNAMMAWKVNYKLYEKVMF